MFTEIREKLMKDEDIQKLLNEDVVLTKAIIAPEMLNKLNKLTFTTLVDNKFPKNEKLDLIKKLYKAGVYQQNPNPVLDFIKYLHIDEQQKEVFEKVCESSKSEPETILDKFFSDPNAFIELNFEVSSDNISRYINFIKDYLVGYAPEAIHKDYFEALILVLNNINPTENPDIQKALFERLERVDYPAFCARGRPYYRDAFIPMLKKLNVEHVLNLIDYFKKESLSDKSTLPWLLDPDPEQRVLSIILKSMLLDNDREPLDKARIIKSIWGKTKGNPLLYQVLDMFFDNITDDPKFSELTITDDPKFRELTNRAILSVLDADSFVEFVSRASNSVFYSKLFVGTDLLSKFSFKVNDTNYKYYKDFINSYCVPVDYDTYPLFYTESKLEMLDTIVNNLEGIEHPEIQKALLSVFSYHAYGDYEAKWRANAMKVMKTILAQIPRHSMISFLQTNFYGKRSYDYSDFLAMGRRFPELTTFILQQLTKQEREEFVVNILSSFSQDVDFQRKLLFVNSFLLDDKDSLEKILLTPNKDGVFIFYDHKGINNILLNEILKSLNKPTIPYVRHFDYGSDAKKMLEQLFVIYPEFKQTMEAAENRNKVAVFARNIVDARKDLSKRIEQQAKNELVDTETAMDQETSLMVNEQFEKIKKKYQAKFESFGATHDERIEAIESKIKEAILSTIIDELMLDRDSLNKKLKQLEETKRTSESSQHSTLDLKIKELNEKIKRKAEILDFIRSNLKLLTELPDPAKDNVLIASEGMTRKELREAARNVATAYLTENTHAQAAWRSYDPLAPYSDAVWKNLLLPPPYGRDPTVRGRFAMFGAREAISDESGSKIVRERAAYYYLLADRAENRSERMDMFITALGEVRRGHIANFSSDKMDEVPCFPGFLSNLATSTLGDPEFPLPMSFHELVKEKMREIFADKFEKALRELKTKAEQDALYQAVTSLSYHNADDILKSGDDALYPPEFIKEREGFLARLPSLEQVLKEVNESVVALTGYPLPKADEVYVRAYYQDPGFDPNRLTIYYQACQAQLEALKLETVDEQPTSLSTLESVEHPFPLPEQADLPQPDEKREAFRAIKINKHRSQAEKHYCYNAFLPIIQEELRGESQEFIAEIVKEMVATLVATNAREPQARIDEVLHDISNRTEDDKLINNIPNEKVISILKKPDTLEGLMKATRQASKYHSEQVEALKKSISPESEKEKPAPEFLSLMGVRKQKSNVATKVKEKEEKRMKEKEEKTQDEKARQDRPPV